LSLRGRHQVANAVTAVVAAELMEGDLAAEPRGLSTTAVAGALGATVLPGRVECLPGRPPIVLDVAHNPASMAALRDALDEYFPGRPLVLLFAMVSTHDPKETAALIAGKARAAVVTEPAHPRALPAGALAEVVRPYVGSVDVVPDRGAALDRALAAATLNDVVCITGSVYLISALRERLVAMRSDEEASARRVG
jgi:dihydrofolate synthase/folylpolyglutamate synthase